MGISFHKNILTLLLGIGVILALYAWYLGREGNISSWFCQAGSGWDCTHVLQSPFSHWLHIPLSLYGVGFYLGLGAMLWGISSRPVGKLLFLFGAGLGVLVSVGLFLITRWVLGAGCSICYSMYGVNGLLLFIAWWAWRPILPLAKKTFQQFPYLPYILLLSLVGLGIGMRIGYPKTPIREVSRTTVDPVFLKQAEGYYQELREKGRTSLMPGIGIPLYGKPDAPVHIFLFSDFQCGWCRKLAVTLKSLTDEFPHQLYVEYLHYPLGKPCNPYVVKNKHPLACRLAAVAQCADQVGKFSEVHDALFLHPESAEQWLTGPYQLCSQRGVIQEKVRKQVILGKRLGVRGTPTLFLNGLKVEASHPVLLRLLIQFELEE